MVKLKNLLSGKNIVITAGGTREFIDPVRFIGNPSTGKMGYEIARAAKRAGADTTLISCPTLLKPVTGVNQVNVTSTLELKKELDKIFEEADVIICAAAVSDYRPVEKKARKIKKNEEKLVIELVRNPDILEQLGTRKGDKILIGFAAETDNLIKNAKEKLKKKNLDIIVANDIMDKDSGFASDKNIVKFIYLNGEVESFPLMSKRKISTKLLHRVAGLLDKKLRVES